MKKIVCVMLMLALLVATEIGVADNAEVVARAQSWVGKAIYKWGACCPGEFDASGFVSYCLTGIYCRIGTTYTFLDWPQATDPQPGDVCVSKEHCGIYMGGGQMIHAAAEGIGVIYTPVQRGMIYVKFPGNDGDPYPSTGDSADPFLWAVALLMSLGLGVTVLKLKRREQ